MIRAIETAYAGCRFRSRLEARWAVMFDRLGIDWRYEPEGFETPAGRYLPDFWLPEHRRWVEVKGGSFTRRDRDRATHVAEAAWQQGHGFRVLVGDIPRRCLASGTLGRGLIKMLGYGHGDLVPVTPESFPRGMPETRSPGQPLPISASPGELLDWAGLRSFSPMWWAPGESAEAVDRALAAARSERFGT